MDKLEKKISYHSGYDCFTPDIGEHKEMKCLACGENMNKAVCSYGPTGMIEAMAGGEHFHDTFTCSNSGKEWHDQVIFLLKYITNCPSKVISDLISKEVDDIIKFKTATKTNYSRW